MATAAVRQFLGLSHTNQRVHSSGTTQQEQEQHQQQIIRSIIHKKNAANRRHQQNRRLIGSRARHGADHWASSSNGGTLRGHVASARQLSRANLSFSDLKAVNLGSAVSKKAQRAKHLILQSVTKYHKTTDEIFQLHETNFCRQHAHAVRLHKELTNYASSLQATLEASKSLNDCLRDVNAGKEWTRHDLFCDISGQIERSYESLIDAIVGQDEEAKPEDANVRQSKNNSNNGPSSDASALDLLDQYAGKFCGVKERIGKRARKLIDYDAARRAYALAKAAHAKRVAAAEAAAANMANSDDIINSDLNDSASGQTSNNNNHQSCNNQQVDDHKLNKQKDAYEMAKRAYQSLNNELHEQLPALYAARVPNVLAIIERMCRAQCEFHSHNERLHAACRSTLETLSRAAGTQMINNNNNNDDDDIAVISSNDDHNNNNNEEIEQKMPGFYNSASIQTKGQEQQKQQQQQQVSKSNNGQRTFSRSGASDCSSGGGAASSFDSSAASSPTGDVDDADNRQHGVDAIVDDSGLSATDNNSASSASSTCQQSDKSSSSSSPIVAEDRQSIGENELKSIITDEEMIHDSPVTSVVVETIKRASASTRANKQTEAALNEAAQRASGISNPQPCTQVPSEATTDNLPEGILYRVKTSYKYLAEDEDELSFDADEIIQVIEYEDILEREDGWLMGVRELNSAKGLFPANFTRPI